jgi:hypothetical protein
VRQKLSKTVTKFMNIPGGVRLRGSWGVMVFNNQTWQRMLLLARHYGWTPKLNDVGYYLTVGNVIPAEDAYAIAFAVERCLPDIPDHQTVATSTDEKPTTTELRRMKDGIGLLEWFSGASKRNLQGLIEFCRVGGAIELS